MFGRKDDFVFVWVFCCVALVAAAATTSSSSNSSSEGRSVGRETGARSAGGIEAIDLQVTPRHSKLRSDGSVTIRCTATGGVNVVDIPNMFFSILDGDSVFAISGIPGVSIVREPPSTGTLEWHSSVLLTIGPQMYPFLRKGENMFVCYAQDIKGDSVSMPFYVSTEV